MISSTGPSGFDPADVAPRQLGSGPWRVGSLALDVSGKCNLACRYCAEGATQPPRRAMSPETLESAWRFLFPDGKPHGYSSIRLGSGEPLLAFDLLVRLRELIESSPCEPDERPRVFLTTNGTLIDNDVTDWLVDSGWHVKISLDGPRSVQDRWRVDRQGRGTFDRIAGVVRELAVRIPERFSVTAVLCQGSDPAAVFGGIAQLGVKRIELVPVSHRDSYVTPNDKDVQSYAEFVHDYARRWTAQQDDDGIPALVRFQNCVARVMGYDVHEVGCGAGRVFLGVGPAGDLYPCFRFIGVDPYRLGSLATGPDPQQVRQFESGPGRSYMGRRQCRECWAAPLCGGPCFACAEMFASGAPPAANCAYVLADAEAAVWMVNQLRASNPEQLLRFLPDEFDVESWLE